MSEQKDMFDEFVEKEVERRVRDELQKVSRAEIEKMTDREHMMFLIKRVHEQNTEIVEMKPKAEFHDRVVASDDLMSIQKAAAALGYQGAGQNKLFDFLRNDEILMTGGEQHNIPYRRHIEAGLFTVKEREWEDPETGKVHVSTKTYVTQKGLIYIQRRLEANGYQPADTVAS